MDLPWCILMHWNEPGCHGWRKSFEFFRYYSDTRDNLSSVFCSALTHVQLGELSMSFSTFCFSSRGMEWSFNKVCLHPQYLTTSAIIWSISWMFKPHWKAAFVQYSSLPRLFSLLPSSVSCPAGWAPGWCGWTPWWVYPGALWQSLFAPLTSPRLQAHSRGNIQ